MPNLPFKVKYLISFCILFINNNLLAQQKPYFQQELKYNITVQLNDSANFLTGFITIEYTNNSPDRLDFLYFHLWPNAYKNDNTAFARQMLQLGKTSFYYSSKYERGYIDSLRFTVNNVPVKVIYDTVNIDICKLILNHTLEPGEKTTIRTPFRVKIPDSFSRMGHVGQAYQISQWYPKPAVYDRDGWHAFPYLDQGEFYSEYGDFDVDITLPKNYVTGASGDLQNPEERNWLDSLAKLPRRDHYDIKSDTFPRSSHTSKTLHYHLKNAHDFAWFADKRYHVVKDSVKLPNSSRIVTTWAFYNNGRAAIWKKGASYVSDAIYWYSKWIGDYPYDVATAVEGGLSAGGGMEYPTITVISGQSNSYSLEDVIVHEVGHNWFYGVLGTNERQHPWMDEGVNTFYEYRYLVQEYPHRMLGGLPKGVARFFDLDKYKVTYGAELIYRNLVLNNEDQPIELPADKYTSDNYGGIVYMKTALALKHLEGYLGRAVFDTAMQAYFEQWKFKHPGPQDMKETLEKASGKNLDWFFGDYLTTNKKVDYAIKKVKRVEDGPAEITISNCGDLNVPFSISGIIKDSVKKAIWYNGCKKDTVIKFPAGLYDFYRIDGKDEMVEVNRKNDTYRMQGWLHKAEVVKIQFLGSIDNPYKNQLYFLPIVGWNNYDKTMVGIAFYNHLVPGKHFEYELMPMVNTVYGTFDGMGHVGYTWTPERSKLRTVNFGVYGKRFSYQLTPDQLIYNKVQPQLTFNFHPKNALSVMSHQLTFRSVTIFMNEDQYLVVPGPNPIEGYYELVDKNIHYTINEARYDLTVDNTINPYSLNVGLQQGSDFIKLSAEAKALLTYEKPGKGLMIRLFGGGFLWNNIGSASVPDPGFRLGYGTGAGDFQKDYMFDELFFERNPSSLDFLSQQVIEKEGGFRIPNLPYGNSIKSWIISLNLKATLPKQIPLRPFLNVAAFGNSGVNASSGETTRYTTTVIEGGIIAAVIPDVIEINFPLFMVASEGPNSPVPSGSWFVGMSSTNPNNIFAGRKYRQMVSFVFNVNKMNPFDVIKGLKL